MLFTYKLRLSVIAVFVCNALVGCNPHLLPQDTTRLSTYQIVAHVRCEAREGVRTYVKGRLDAFKTMPVYRDDELRRMITADELVARLDKSDEAWHKLNTKNFIHEIKSNFEYYKDAQISYDFTFDLNEANAHNATFGFVRNFPSKRVDALGFSFGDSLMRENRRNLRAFDTFIELALKVDDNYCSNTPRGPNYVYPLTGSLRVDDLVGTFLNLNEKGNLVGAKENASVPSVADTINFTTKFNANVNPSFVLVPLAKAFSLSTFAFADENSRSDQNQVIIAISLAPKTLGTYKFDKNGNIVAVAQAVSQRDYANEVLDNQRTKALQDAVIQFGTTAVRGIP